MGLLDSIKDHFDDDGEPSDEDRIDAEELDAFDAGDVDLNINRKEDD